MKMNTDFAKSRIIDYYSENPELNPIQILNEYFEDVFYDVEDIEINKKKLSLSLLDFYIRELIFDFKKEEMLKKEINARYKFSVSVASSNSFIIKSSLLDYFEAYIIFTEKHSKITCLYNIDGSPKMKIEELISDFIEMIDLNY